MLTAVVLFDPRIVTHPNKGLTSFRRDDGVVQTHDMQRRGLYGVKIAIGLVAADESANTDAICKR